MDGLLQPRIGGLYHGVSRQAPLLRSPSQMEDLENFLPSVDIGGIVDRAGASAIIALPPGQYRPGNHHFFRTTDGTRWVLLKRAAFGQLEVRNLVNGAIAPIDYGIGVQSYIGDSEALKFLTITDTTLILNPTVVVRSSVAAKPAMTSCYVVVKRMTTAAQSFSVTSSAGVALVSFLLNNTVSRDAAAMQLQTKIDATMPGVITSFVRPSVIKLSGTAEVIASVQVNNDWDGAAIQVIKGRVNSMADLPATFEPGVPLMVDTGSGEAKSAYYVHYDLAKNAWIESSYALNGVTTATLVKESMPLKLRQVGPSSFSLDWCDWSPRKTGDDESNSVPEFVGKPVTAIAQWKGRLWLAAHDTLYSSQPDDLFNFWRTSAREVRPSDPVILPADTPDVGNIQHLVAIRNKLMVLCENAQLEVPGDVPVTPADAVIGVATRYQLNEGCAPQVVGDALYFAGSSEGRSALWEYGYDESSASNTAEDLSKHVPNYVPGKVLRIAGSAQAGRRFIWTPSAPSTLFLHTGYFKAQERAQSAWSKVTFQGIGTIEHFWVNEGSLYILARSAVSLWLLALPVEADLGTTVRLDFQSPAQIFWNETLKRSEVILPAGYHALPALTLEANGRAWPLAVTWDGTQWLAGIYERIDATFGLLGTRFPRRAVFSPFYASVGDKPTPLGRLQIRNVVLDALVAGDFRVTVQRPDRVQQVYDRAPRVIGEALVPLLGHNQQHRIPFNSRGDAATLTFETTSTGPTALTGYTLTGRYTNPYAS